MLKTLIITHGQHQGNRMYDSDTKSYSESVIFTDAENLEEFCEILVENGFKDFEDAPNFSEEIKKIAPQFETNHFAQIKFQYPSSIYNIAIISPKF